VNVKHRIGNGSVLSLVVGLYLVGWLVEVRL
jgi:hypothetical protein